MFTTVVAVRFNTRPCVNLILSALYQARGYKIMMLNLIKSDDHPMIQILVQGLGQRKRVVPVFKRVYEARMTVIVALISVCAYACVYVCACFDQGSGVIEFARRHLRSESSIPRTLALGHLHPCTV